MTGQGPQHLFPKLFVTHWCGIVAALLTAHFVCPLSASAQDSAQAFLKDLTQQVTRAEQKQQSALAGAQGWQYFVPELRSLSVGTFWGEAAPRVSRASKPEYADPLPAIVDFHQQLQQAGIELLLVPVPAKVAIYPEFLSSAVTLSNGVPADRLDPTAREFYDLLEQQGIHVLDLTPLYLKHRDDAGGPLFCKTDTHWSGRGVVLAAEAIGQRVKERDWMKEVPKHMLPTNTRDVEITGDLARLLNEDHPVRETLPLTFVGQGSDQSLTPLDPARNSPVLLIGDSHTLVFHDPTLYARGAGLPDHLAHQLGFAVDLVGVRGSGATTTRIELLRRKDNLQGKRLVIWCFSFREFTESFTGWRKIPVIR